MIEKSKPAPGCEQLKVPRPQGPPAFLSRVPSYLLWDKQESQPCGPSPIPGTPSFFFFFFNFCQQTGQRHSCVLKEDSLSHVSTKQNFQMFLFWFLNPLHAKEHLASFYVKSNTLLVIFAIFRKQRNSLLSRLSPTETKNQKQQ